jgi:hypothetical protein
MVFYENEALEVRTIHDLLTRFRPCGTRRLPDNPHHKGLVCYGYFEHREAAVEFLLIAVARHITKAKSGRTDIWPEHNGSNARFYVTFDTSKAHLEVLLDQSQTATPFAT